MELILQLDVCVCVCACVRACVRACASVRARELDCVCAGTQHEHATSTHRCIYSAQKVNYQIHYLSTVDSLSSLCCWCCFVCLFVCLFVFNCNVI